MTARAADKVSTPLSYGERREALLRAVVTISARAGLRSVTYRSLAQEAGVSHGLIAHHFGSIDNLLAAALELSIETSADVLDLRPSSNNIDAFARNLIQGVDELAHDLTFQYQIMLDARSSGDVGGRIRSLHHAYRDVLRESLAHIGAPNDSGTVELVYATLEGIIFHQLTYVESTNNELALQRLREHLLLASQHA